MRVLLCFLILVCPLAAADDAPHPQLADLIGRYLQRDYYDPGRFDPPVMLRKALQALESGHVAIDTTRDGDKLRLRIGEVRTALPVDDVDSLAGVMSLLGRIQGVIMASDLLSEDERKGLVYGMINGALRTLDPHTIVIPPEPAQEFSESVIEGEFFGIGAYLSSEEGAVRIDRVMPGLPADMAGVKNGDVILYIDGETTAGLTLTEAVRRIKGPQGTTVALTVEREGADDNVIVEVVRDRVKPITMRSYRAGDIGYVRMDEFNGPSFTDLRVKLLELKNRHRDRPLQGLVLDLRFNGGGRLDQAHYIADLFLPPGREVVVTVEPGEKPDIRTSSRNMLIDVPMLVMVSSGSASAAEILSGALQQNDRAVVLGQTTFGKGSVQTWRPLPDQSFIKFTIQEYQLADGVSIQGQGIMPDLQLTKHAERRDGRIDMVPFTRQAEADDEFSLEGHGTYFNESRFDLFWLQEQQEDDDWDQHRISHPDFRPDQEAELAMDLLESALAPVIAANSGQPVQLQRQQLLDALEPAVAARQERESGELAARLAAGEPPITWGEPPLGEVASDAVTLRLDSEPRAEPGSTLELPFTVVNAGNQDVVRLYGIVNADDASPFWESEMVFGAVPVGQERSAVLRLRIPPRIGGFEERFAIDLIQQGSAAVLSSTPVTIGVDPASRPHLGYDWKLIDSDGDGAIGLDEPVRLQIDIHNSGEGASAPLVVYLRKEDNPFVQLEAARWRLEPVAAGDHASIEVPLTVRGSLTVGSVTKANKRPDLELVVAFEERFAEGTSHYMAEDLVHRLSLPLGQPLAGASIRQPRIVVDSRAVDSTGGLDLSYHIEDDNPTFAAVFLDDDKVFVAALGETAERAFSHRLQLKPGINEVRVVALDADGLTRVELLRLWADESIPEPADVESLAEMP